MQTIILNQVSKSYLLGMVKVIALNNINLTIHPNRFTVIAGPSGSGKSTLLNMIGCIDRPDNGDIFIKGLPVSAMSDNELTDFRIHNMGFIFQNFNLLPVLTVYENVEYPLLLKKIPAHIRRKRIMTLLDAVGLTDKIDNRPCQLSGGQRQRVAIARALAASPKQILADEPTANLDSETGSSIITLMREMQREHKVSFVFSSHDPKVIEESDDVIIIKDGCIMAIERR